MNFLSDHIDSGAEKTTAKASETEQDAEKFAFSNLSQILPAIVAFIEKLDQQLLKALQILTPSSLEYMLRLRDESDLIKQCERTMEFLKRASDVENQQRVALIMLEHVYFKTDSLYAKTKEALKNHPDKLKELWIPSTSVSDIVSDLVKLVLSNSQSKVRVKTICLQLYHLALNNRFTEAKDILMRNRLHHGISKQKIQIQVLFNRALVQIALAAFRLGQFEEANQMLNSVFSTPNLKESLA
jgi:translation initiation factor 3 subunit C